MRENSSFKIQFGIHAFFHIGEVDIQIKLKLLNKRRRKYFERE
jgi:hypothetical protein